MIPHHFCMYYVYVIKSKQTDQYYIGLTNDIQRRLKEHNDGHSYWTKSHGPFELVYYEAYRSLEDAKIREKKLKQYKNGYMELKKRLFNSIELLTNKSGGG